MGFEFKPPTMDQIRPDSLDDGTQSAPGMPHGSSPGADLEAGMDPKSWVNRHGNWIDRNIMPAFRGFNKLFANIPDSIINSILGEEADVVRRAFAAGDYEDVKTIIPHLLVLGKGAYIGPGEGLQNYVDSFGKGVGFSAPFFGFAGRTFQAAQKLPKLVREGTKLFSKVRLPWQTPVGTGTTKSTLYGKIAEGIGKGYTKKPLSTYGMESTVGGLGFAGYELGEDLFGEDSVGAPLTSVAVAFSPAGLYYGVKGGVITPGTWLAKKGYGLAQKGITKYREGKGISSGEIDVATSDSATSKIVRSELGKDFERALKDNEEAVRRAFEIEEELQLYADEPFGFTVGEATGDVPLIGTQKQFETGAKPELASQINQRKLNIHNAIRNWITGKYGNKDELDQSMLVVHDEISGKYIDLLGKIDDGIASNIDNLRAVHTEGHVLDRQALGRNIQTRLLDIKNKIDTKMEKLAKKLKINKTDTLAKADDVEASQIIIRNNRAIVPKHKDGALSYEGVHPLIKKFIDFRGKLTFQDWKNFRSQVSDDLGKAINHNRSSDIKSLAILKEELDNLGKSFGQINNNFKQFNTVYQTERIVPFENAKINKVMETFDGKARFVLDGEKVAKQFMGGTEDAGAFMRVFGNDPIMLNHMKNAVLDDVLQKVMIKTGENELKINPRWAANLEKYLNDNREVLAELNLIKGDGTGLLDGTKIPGVKGQGIRNILNNLAQRSGDLDNRRRAITENILIQKLFSKKDGSGVPSIQEFNKPDELNEFFLDLLNPKNAGLLKTMTKRVSDLNNPELSNTFNNIMLRKIVERTKALDNPQKFKQYVNDNAETLDTIFRSKDHTNNLYKLAETFEIASRIGGPVSGSPNDIKTWMDQLYKQLGTSVQGQTARFIAVAENRIGIPSALAYMLMRAGTSQKQIAMLKLYEKAMFDPALARALASRVEPRGTNGAYAPSPQNLRRINHGLWNLGLPPFYGGSESELELPTIELEGFQLPANISEVIPPVEEEAVVDVAQNIPTDNRRPLNPNTISLPDFPRGNSINQGIGGLAKNKVSSSDLFPFDATANLIEQRKGGAPRSVA